MTIVTDKQFFMEKHLVSKLDLIIQRLTGTDDGVLILSGDEGQGKTNLLTGICYYVSYVTGRPYGPENIFFDLDKLIDFATKTEGQIIHWDEGALGGLATEWWSKNQQKFMKLLMVARKKRHFLGICIPKFYKLNEYIVVDRAIGLIHVYSRQNIQKGRFFYYTKAKKESLYMDWRRSRRRSYAKYASFGGSFLEYMPKVFTEEQIKQYDKMKDKAILAIGEDDKNKMSNKEKQLIITKYNAWKKAKDNSNSLTMTQVAEVFGVSISAVSKWENLYDNYSFLRNEDS